MFRRLILSPQTQLEFTPWECQDGTERLRNLGIDPNVPKSELLPVLSAESTDLLYTRPQKYPFWRAGLKGLNLGDTGDVPVSRKVSKNKSLPMKLSEDICALLVCLKNNSTIPRSLVKNGKRDREYLANSRVSSEV